MRRARHSIARFTLLAALLGASACGGGGEAEVSATPAPAATATPAAQATPTEAELAPRLELDAATRRALERGETGLVDLEDHAAVAPTRLRANREQVVRGIEWSGWGQRSAKGTGTVRTLVCEPTCARGQSYDSAAKLTASAPRKCGSRRYYSKLRLVHDDPARGPDTEPATFLRTPC